MDEAESGLPPWSRSREGRVIAGVCAGFAHRLGMSPWIVRAILVFATVITAGLAAVVYVILAITLPVDAEPDGGAESGAETEAELEPQDDNDREAEREPQDDNDREAEPRR